MPTLGGSTFGSISGPLPFGAGGGGGYAGAYNSALAQNQAMYANIMAGYQQTVAAQTAAQQAIQAGYTTLYNDVQGQINQLGATQVNDINAASAAEVGAATQGLLNRGLGNTTIQTSVAAGLESNRQRQLTAANESTAKLRADSMSSLGLASLDAQNRHVNENAALAIDQLRFMNSLSAPYPDASLYAGGRGGAAGGGGGTQYSSTYGGGSFSRAGGGPQVGYVPTYASVAPAMGYSAAAAGGGGTWLGQQSVPTLNPLDYSWAGGGGGFDFGGAAAGIGAGVYGAAGGGFDYGGFDYGGIGAGIGAGVYDAGYAGTGGAAYDDWGSF